MLLNLKQLAQSARHGENTQDFAYRLDLSAVKFWGEAPFSQPVEISGQVKCDHEIYTVRYTVNCTQNGACSRCLTAVSRDFIQSYEHVILEEVQDEALLSEFILAPNGQLDVDELVTSDILLELQGVVLCRENCRGLCPKCGKNRNLGDCGCDLRERDTRFDVLRKLLNEE